MAFRDWALPVDQLGEGARYYRYDPAEAGDSSPRPATRADSPG